MKGELPVSLVGRVVIEERKVILPQVSGEGAWLPRQVYKTVTEQSVVRGRKIGRIRVRMVRRPRLLSLQRTRFRRGLQRAQLLFV